MLLHNRQKFERHAAGAFSSGLSFLDCAFPGVELACKLGLTHAMSLAQLIDLFRLEFRRRRQAGFVEAAHGRRVHASHLVQRRSGNVDRLEGIALEFSLAGHCKSPPHRQQRFR